MLKPNMPNIPGMGAMTDTLEFVKSLWGGMGVPGMGMQGMNVPGMVMPTLSVDEIRKRISDLKAVETWLELNMNMLRGTIQTLEVQAATIATLQTMGEALNATVKAGTPNIKPEPAQEEPAPAPSEEQEAPKAAEPTSKDEADAASLTAPLVNAAAWWNMLQSQFQQAVTNAIAAAETSAGMAPGSSVGNGADRSDSGSKDGAGATSPPSAPSASASTTRRRKPSPK